MSIGHVFLSFLILRDFTHEKPMYFLLDFQFAHGQGGNLALVIRNAVGNGTGKYTRQVDVIGWIEMGIWENTL